MYIELKREKELRKTNFTRLALCPRPNLANVRPARVRTLSPSPRGARMSASHPFPPFASPASPVCHTITAHFPLLSPLSPLSARVDLSPPLPTNPVLSPPLLFHSPPTSTTKTTIAGALPLPTPHPPC